MKDNPLPPTFKVYILIKLHRNKLTLLTVDPLDKKEKPPVKNSEGFLIYEYKDIPPGKVEIKLKTSKNTLIIWTS